MKQLIALFLSLCLLSVCPGCGQTTETVPNPAELSDSQPAETEPVDAVPDPIDDPWGLMLSASDVTPTGLALTFTQSGGSFTGELIYGSMYWLERETGDGWDSVPALDGEESHFWTTVAYIIPMNDSCVQNVNWETFYGALETGHYRIGKTVSTHLAAGDSDDKAYYAEFDIE